MPSETMQEALMTENRELKQKIEQLKVVENMQNEIVNAGGRFFTAEELLDMTIADFVDHFGPNGITFEIKYEGKV